MTLGIHTTVTNPEQDKFAWREAIQNYLDLADQVIVVDGCSTDGTWEELQEWSKKESSLKIVQLPWPREQWHWSELPKHLNAGLRHLQTDWRLKLDIDCLIHEKDFVTLRYALTKKANSFLAASLQKSVILNRESYYRKCDVPFCLNFTGTVVYGIAKDNPQTDWCYPILWDGKTIDMYNVPIGQELKVDMCYRTGIDVWDYDYFFRTKEETKERFWKFAQSWYESHDASWGTTKEEAWQVFIQQGKSRLQKQTLPLSIQSHPQCIQTRLQQMTEDMYGYHNWNHYQGL